MLLSCIKAEQMKLRRSFIWIAFFLLPLIPAVMGMKNYLNNWNFSHRDGILSGPRRHCFIPISSSVR